MNAKLPAILSVLLLTSCVHKYAVPGPTHDQGHLRVAATIFVVTPRDGRDDRPKTYEGSGVWTSSALADALRARGMQVVMGGTETALPKAIEAAAAAGADFIVYPQISHWSDRATEWSGIPDRITLLITVYDVATSAVLDRQEIRASSRWATFGGDHPQELLPELTRRWAETATE
jgi:hypothetical protein